MKNLEDNFTQKYIKYKTKYLTTLSLHSKGGWIESGGNNYRVFLSNFFIKKNT